VHAVAPEIGILEIFARGIAEQPRDVLAHKQWREIIPGLEAVDHRRGGVEQACKLHLRSGLNLGEMLAFLFFVLAHWGSSLLGKAGQSNCPSGKVLSMARPSVRASYLM